MWAWTVEIDRVVIRDVHSGGLLVERWFWDGCNCIGAVLVAIVEMVIDHFNGGGGGCNMRWLYLYDVGNIRFVKALVGVAVLFALIYYAIWKRTKTEPSPT
ncbi:hypothetical protein DPMN_176504 [Dreissena polymorpha]|uniref:Uncharacterized protein n=1 Tax=Dreissena polymorpha TaxID=45954 RepID=A0A9D4E711_DREPO|nr:hypothetical protein DPMN_176504 [Dreissena polymorpha]